MGRQRKGKKGGASSRQDLARWICKFNHTIMCTNSNTASGQDKKLPDVEAGLTDDSPVVTKTQNHETTGQEQGGGTKQPNPAGECRICLLSDEPQTFVKPCHCTGSRKWCLLNFVQCCQWALSPNWTFKKGRSYIVMVYIMVSSVALLDQNFAVEYAHLKCLKSWVRERVDLHCEICKFKYNEALLVKLEPEILAGAAQRLQRRTSSVVVVPGQRSRGGGQQQQSGRICGKHAMMRATCIVLFVCALVGLLLFLGLNASDSPWAAILLRILAFGIPVLIIIRGVVACMEIRRMQVANQR